MDGESPKKSLMEPLKEALKQKTFKRSSEYLEELKEEFYERMEAAENDIKKLYQKVSGRVVNCFNRLTTRTRGTSST